MRPRSLAANEPQDELTSRDDAVRTDRIELLRVELLRQKGRRGEVFQYVSR